MKSSPYFSRTAVFLLFILFFAVFGGTTRAQSGPESRIVVPSPVQLAWHNRGIGMFIHFAPNTWSDLEFDDLSVPLVRIRPDKLSTNQWVSVAKSMGARHIVFVAKHVGGFCWWPTRTTDYCVRNIPWRDGRGDLLRELAESCKAGGIGLGVYLSPADAKQGAGVGGRCAEPSLQSAYVSLYRRQLEEVLCNYGDICEVWFDGSLVFDVSDIVKKCAPNAVVFQGPGATIRWVGNEDGVAPDPAWNTVRSDSPPVREGTATAADGDPDGDLWLPLECDARMRNTWFWNSKNQNSLKSVDALLSMYEQSVGRGAVLLLNHAPDMSGLIPDADATRAAQFGAAIRQRYENPVGSNRGNGNVVELNLSSPTNIDAVSTMENISTGARVRKYSIDAFITDSWKTIASGTSVGRLKIDRFPTVLTSRLRITIHQSSGIPELQRFAAHRIEVPEDRAVMNSLRAPEFIIHSPVEYQVFQRQTPTQGIIKIAGRAPASADRIEAKVYSPAVASGGGYATIATNPATHTFQGELTAPAGGWNRVEIRARRDEVVLETRIIERVGVGEVFVGAGQSNSTNYGDRLLTSDSGFVSTFSGTAWRPAHDPQPGAHDRSTGGSFWPAFGDLMYSRFRVPIGIAVTGHGGTSIGQWQRDGDLFQWFLARLLQFGPGGVRAVLWHQGESDVNMSTEQYALGLSRIIEDSRVMTGVHVPWFVANVTYISDRPSSPAVRAAQSLLWKSGVAEEGPDTDTLTAEFRDLDGRGVHFNERGLREHGRLWFVKVSAWLERVLEAPR